MAPVFVMVASSRRVVELVARRGAHIRVPVRVRETDGPARRSKNQSMATTVLSPIKKEATTNLCRSLSRQHKHSIVSILKLVNIMSDDNKVSGVEARERGCERRLTVDDRANENGRLEVALDKEEERWMESYLLREAPDSLLMSFSPCLP